jgi:hypothetical protein
MMVFNKKWLFSVLFFLSLNVLALPISAGLTNPMNLNKMVFALYTWWFKPDRSLPSLDKLNIVTFLPIESCSDDSVVNEADDGRDGVIDLLKKKDGVVEIEGKLYRIYNGIPEEIKNFKEPINLYLGGFSNSGYPHAFSIYKGIKEGTMIGPCIVFESVTDTRRTFNFCQEQDLHCVDIVYKDLIKKHAKARIILKGGCKGAAVYLRYLAEKAKHGGLENIKALIANYPPISVKDALKDIRYGGALSHLFCRFTLPNYNPHSKTILDATDFPSDIPVLLSCLPKGNDRISDLDDMRRIRDHLESLGVNIELFVSKGIAEDGKILGHGQLGRAKDYQEKILEFLGNHDLLQ